MQALREWWRLFDVVEGDLADHGVPSQKVRSVKDIGELHRQRAFDDNMRRGPFGAVLAAINIARKAQGLRQLLWSRPAFRPRARHLPPESQVREVRIALKHGWFATLDRWQTADELLAGREPTDAEELRLLRNYRMLEAAQLHAGQPRPRKDEVLNGRNASSFYADGFSLSDMFRGRYPDAEDIRYAFYLCLASTGWNPSVLLTIDANSGFIETHPKDPTRYLLRGYKARSRSEQYSEGLYKSQGSAGVVIQTLISRTEPLRVQLRKELNRQEFEYQRMLRDGEPAEQLDAQRKVVTKLQIGVSSPWLYVATSTDEIVWLDPNLSVYAKGVNGGEGTSFLDGLIGRLNADRSRDQQIAPMTAGDFRDAFAAYAYRISGGMVLYVMKALGHKSPQSTQIYLNKTQLNDQSVELFRTFSNALWSEIKVHKRLDPTIVAKCSRDGEANAVERARLDSYRTLSRSRIGVGCKDPTRPPAHIAPNFRVDGRAMCHVQRCMLCLEHAVIFPDSLPGLTKRLAELRAIQRRMSVIAFLESSFGQEMENTELALSGFNDDAVAASVRDWESRIYDGTHFVIDLDGLQGEA
ncbi:MAG: hypothetical protein KXJ61_05615 [Hydrogenophaga sp.]|jgi:hypothetical protein|uniref:hypothetical protein n=1 Tax=Hydrogenophaga sp. TaxID=1904254 RepID=UPI001D231764|nr:hypothetical protein [Hydrogenophaga sp.]MBW0169689.1 hypothetical protein [Hydrogenophaga sp.]MBW0183312.1 hypothetical protein [Hydrogenophaga sp.]